MTVRAPGKASSRFIGRIDHRLRSAFWRRADRGVTIDGAGSYCVSFIREREKLENEETGVNATKTEAVWLTSDCLPIRKNSVLGTGNEEFVVRHSPVNTETGFMRAAVRLRCDC